MGNECKVRGVTRGTDFRFKSEEEALECLYQIERETKEPGGFVVKTDGLRSFLYGDRFFLTNLKYLKCREGEPVTSASSFCFDGAEFVKEPVELFHGTSLESVAKICRDSLKRITGDNYEVVTRGNWLWSTSITVRKSKP